MRTITVLLTGYSDWFSTFLCCIDKGYSHASIAIDEKEEVFYSFNKKGFCIEKPKKYAPKSRRKKSVCIRMQVPDDVYHQLEDEIWRFIEHRESYKYSRMGVILCLLHIPYKFHNKYFCSQFVSEVLAKAGVVELQKKESLYMPSQLISQLRCRFAEMQLFHNVI